MGLDCKSQIALLFVLFCFVLLSILVCSLDLSVFGIEVLLSANS